MTSILCYSVPNLFFSFFFKLLWIFQNVEDLSFNKQNTIQSSQILGPMLAHLHSVLQYGDFPALYGLNKAVMDF